MNESIEKKSNANKNYINAKELLNEIYKSRERDELTPRALDLLMKLAQRSIRKLYYKCEDDKQNALSEAYFDIVKNWRKFNPDWARLTGYELLDKGDQIRVFIDEERIKTAGATVIENYPLENKIKLEYIIKKGEKQIKIFDKNDIIIKEPNAFSFFTSCCVNGFAKGWKILNPPKSKGVFVSLDSGDSAENSGLHSLR